MILFTKASLSCTLKAVPSSTQETIFVNPSRSASSRRVCSFHGKLCSCSLDAVIPVLFSVSKLLWSSCWLVVPLLLSLVTVAGIVEVHNEKRRRTGSRTDSSSLFGNRARTSSSKRLASEALRITPCVSNETKVRQLSESRLEKQLWTWFSYIGWFCGSYARRSCSWCALRLSLPRNNLTQLRVWSLEQRMTISAFVWTVVNSLETGEGREWHW